MKKICLFVFCLFLLTGCSIDYNLDIDNVNKLKEIVTVYAINESESNQIEEYDGFLPIDIEFDDSSIFERKIDGLEYYSVKKSMDSSKIRFQYNYNIVQFGNDYFACSCYQYITAMDNKEDNELILSTSKKFLCFDKFETLEKVKVTLRSTYKLNETNADEVEGHNYIWYITRENANNKYLYLSLDTSVRNLTLWEKIIEGEYTNIFTVSVLLFIVGMGIYWFFKKKSERRDRI